MRSIVAAICLPAPCFVLANLKAQEVLISIESLLRFFFDNQQKGLPFRGSPLIFWLSLELINCLSDSNQMLK
jgi:hypothetical protein